MTLDTSLGWRAKIFRTFALKSPISLDLTFGTRNPADFALDFRHTFGFEFDGRGHSPGDFTLQIGDLAMFFASPVPRGFGFDLPISMSFEARERYSRDFGLNLPITMPFVPREHYARNFALNAPLRLEFPAVGRSIANPRWIHSGSVNGTATTGLEPKTNLDCSWAQTVPPSAEAAIVDFWHDLSYTGAEQIPEFDVEIGGVPCQILANTLMFADRSQRRFEGYYVRGVNGWAQYDIPLWADIVDVVGLGPGCGGNAGGFGVSGGGSGGGAGQWNSRRLIRGVDFGWEATPQIYAAMVTGSPGASGANAIAGPPAAMFVTLGGAALFTCSGGSVGAVGYAGWGNALTHVFQGITYTSGQNNGATPGCGGSGGASSLTGGNAGVAGGGSALWIRCWENERHYRRRLLKAGLFDVPGRSTNQTTSIKARTSSAVRQQLSGRTSFFDNILNFGPAVVASESSREFIDNFQRPDSSSLGDNWIEYEGPVTGATRMSVGIVGNTARPLGVGGRVYIWRRPLSRKDFEIKWTLGDLPAGTPNPEYYLIFGAETQLSAGRCATVYLQQTATGLSNIYVRSSLNTNFTSLNQQTQRAASLTTIPAGVVITVQRINGVYNVWANQTHVTQLAWDSRDSGGNDSTIHPINPITYGYVGFALYTSAIQNPAFLRRFEARDLV